MLTKESLIKNHERSIKDKIWRLLNKTLENDQETNKHICDALYKKIGPHIIEVIEEREELKESLRFTHNKIYTLYHTKDSLKRKDLEIDLIKAYYNSGNTLFNKFIINKHWVK